MKQDLAMAMDQTPKRNRRATISITNVNSIMPLASETRFQSVEAAILQRLKYMKKEYAKKRKEYKQSKAVVRDLDIAAIVKKYNMNSVKFEDAMDTLGMVEEDLELNVEEEIEYRQELTKEQVQQLKNIRKYDKQRRILDRYIKIFELLDGKVEYKDRPAPLKTRNKLTGLSGLSMSVASQKDSMIDVLRKSFMNTLVFTPRTVSRRSK